MTPVCGRLKSFCQCICHSSFNVNKIQSLTHATLFSRLPETNKPFCVKLTKEKCVCLICGTTFTFLIPLVSWNSLKWKSLAFVTPCLGLTGLLTSTYRTSKKKAGKKKKNATAVMVDIVWENLLFCTFNTFDFSWEPSQSWEAFSFTEPSKGLLLLLQDPCTQQAQKKPSKRLTFSQKQLAKWYFCNGLLLGFICVV